MSIQDLMPVLTTQGNPARTSETQPNVTDVDAATPERMLDDDSRNKIHQVAFELGGTNEGGYILTPEDLDAIIDATVSGHQKTEKPAAGTALLVGALEAIVSCHSHEMADSEYRDHTLIRAKHALATYGCLMAGSCIAASLAKIGTTASKG